MLNNLLQYFQSLEPVLFILPQPHVQQDPVRLIFFYGVEGSHLKFFPSYPAGVRLNYYGIPALFIKPSSYRLYYRRLPLVVYYKYLVLDAVNQLLHGDPLSGANTSHARLPPVACDTTPSKHHRAFYQSVGHEPIVMNITGIDKKCGIPLPQNFTLAGPWCVTRSEHSICQKHTCPGVLRLSRLHGSISGLADRATGRFIRRRIRRKSSPRVKMLCRRSRPKTVNQHEMRHPIELA